MYMNQQRKTWVIMMTEIRKFTFWWILDKNSPLLFIFKSGKLKIVILTDNDKCVTSSHVVQPLDTYNSIRYI